MTLVELLATADAQRIDRRPTPIDIAWARRVLATPAGRAIAEVWDALGSGTDCDSQRALDRAEALVAP